MVDRKGLLPDDALDLLLRRWQSDVLKEGSSVFVDDPMVAVAIDHIAHNFVDLAVLHKFSFDQLGGCPFLLKVQEEIDVHLKRILKVSASVVVLPHGLCIEFGLMVSS